MNKTHSAYIQVFPYEGFTFGCDSLIKWLRRETAINNHLVEQCGVDKIQRVLDLGCGTAALAILIKKAHPGADVIGIDGDRKNIEIAEAKTRAQGLTIPLFDAKPFDIPCRDNYFDRVFVSTLFHHLPTKDKIRAAEEMYRILKPGGELHVADFGRPRNSLMVFIARIMRKFDGMDDNIQGLLPHIAYAANFEHIETMTELKTIFGTISLFRAKKPLNHGGESRK
jgi:ubiquinone/menaquinone biosynthesis C-methylase UbiE